MRVLITGATGFVGSHLCGELLSHDHEVWGTHWGPAPRKTALPVDRALSLDVTDQLATSRLIADVKPDCVIHLAGIATTQHTADSARKLFEINVTGAANVAESLQRLGTPASLLLVSSAFVYGGRDLYGSFRYSESSLIAPRGRYGASKLAAESAARVFASDLFRVYVARPFNHIGPGQDASFVVPGLARKIRTAPASGKIETGNLLARRDFTDVRDVVRGYRMIIEQQPDEDCFVFGSGEGRPIVAVFEWFAKLAGKDVIPMVADQLMRSNDDAEYLADFSLARRVLGWSPKISFEESLRDVWNESQEIR